MFALRQRPVGREYSVEFQSTAEAWTFSEGLGPIRRAWLRYLKEDEKPLVMKYAPKTLESVHRRLRRDYAVEVINSHTEGKNFAHHALLGKVVTALAGAIGKAEPYIIQPEPIIYGEEQVLFNPISDDILPPKPVE